MSLVTIRFSWPGEARTCERYWDHVPRVGDLVALPEVAADLWPEARVREVVWSDDQDAFPRCPLVEVRLVDRRAVFLDPDPPRGPNTPFTG